MPAQLIDAILPFMKFHEHIGEVDPRRSIFLFLRFPQKIIITIRNYLFIGFSNGGSNAIAERTLEYYQKGKAREEIGFQEVS